MAFKADPRIERLARPGLSLLSYGDTCQIEDAIHLEPVGPERINRRAVWPPLDLRKPTSMRQTATKHENPWPGTAAELVAALLINVDICLR